MRAYAVVLVYVIPSACALFGLGVGVGKLLKHAASLYEEPS